MTLKETAAGAGVGLAVLGEIFFGAEATSAIVGEAGIDLMLSAWVRLDAGGRALGFSVAAVATAAKVYAKTIKENINNNRELLTELRNCARDHAPKDGIFGWLSGDWNKLGPH